MRVLVIVIVIVTWESKANSSSSLTQLQTGTELGNYFDNVCVSELKSVHEHSKVLMSAHDQPSTLI